MSVKTCECGCTFCKWDAAIDAYVCAECGDIDDTWIDDEPEHHTCMECSGTGTNWDGLGDCEYCDGYGYKWWME